MKTQKAAINTLIISLLVALVGLVLAFSRLGLKLSGGSIHMIDFPQLFLCMAACAVFAFVFSWLRFNLHLGLTMLVATVHDLLLNFGLVSILGILLPQAATLPALVMLFPVFTFSQTLPLLRALMALRTANSLREMSHEAVAEQAVKQTARIRLFGAALAAVLLLAGAVSGNLDLLSQMLALAIGLAVSIYSVTQISPRLWAYGFSRLGVKAAR